MKLTWLRALPLVLCPILFQGGAAAAQSYPAKPIRIIVPYRVSLKISGSRCWSKTAPAPRRR